MTRTTTRHVEDGGGSRYHHLRLQPLLDRIAEFHRNNDEWKGIDP